MSEKPGPCSKMKTSSKGTGVVVFIAMDPPVTTALTAFASVEGKASHTMTTSARTIGYLPFGIPNPCSNTGITSIAHNNRPRTTYRYRGARRTMQQQDERHRVSHRFALFQRRSLHDSIEWRRASAPSNIHAGAQTRSQVFPCIPDI